MNQPWLNYNSSCFLSDVLLKLISITVGYELNGAVYFSLGQTCQTWMQVVCLILCWNKIQSETTPLHVWPNSTVPCHIQFYKLHSHTSHTNNFSTCTFPFKPIWDDAISASWHWLIILPVVDNQPDCWVLRPRSHSVTSLQPSWRRLFLSPLGHTYQNLSSLHPSKSLHWASCIKTTPSRYGSLKSSQFS
jgi:hypothetical protein